MAKSVKSDRTSAKTARADRAARRPKAAPKPQAGRKPKAAPRKLKAAPKRKVTKTAAKPKAAKAKAAKAKTASRRIVPMPENLAKWLSNPDSVKSGTLMKLPRKLTDAEIATLVAYLRSHQ